MKLYLVLIGRQLAKEFSLVADLVWKGMWFGVGLFASVGLLYWVWKLFN